MSLSIWQCFRKFQVRAKSTLSSTTSWRGVSDGINSETEEVNLNISVPFSLCILNAGRMWPAPAEKPLLARWFIDSHIMSPVAPFLLKFFLVKFFVKTRKTTNADGKCGDHVLGQRLCFWFPHSVHVKKTP